MLTTVTFVAAVPPRLTVAPAVKPVPVMLTAVPPLLVPELGEIALTVGAGLVPVPLPVRFTVCGLLLASSAMVIVPVRVPVVVGVKVTLIVQFAPAANVAPQVLLCASSPLAAMLVMFNSAVPMLLRVTPLGALVLPTCWSVKL